VANPDVDLWMQSTTLQTALMQAYMAFRLSDLMLGLGGALVLAGSGIAASPRRLRPPLCAAARAASSGL
jgi:hypothetical protein